jgi:hypothetical protein
MPARTPTVPKDFFRPLVSTARSPDMRATPYPPIRRSFLRMAYALLRKVYTVVAAGVNLKE